ncbi:MAG: DMT family transporter [Hyphomicrobiaceae bacterium]
MSRRAISAADARPSAAAPGVGPFDATGVAVVLACCLIWGGTQVAVKIAGQAIPPILQAGLRSALAGGLLVAWMMFRSVPIRVAVGTGGLGLMLGLIFSVEFWLLYEGVARTTAARAALFLYATPFFVAIGAHLFIPGDRLSATKVAGLVAAFAGLALAVSEGLVATSGRVGSLFGDLLCLGSAVGWASVTVLVRATRLKTVPPEMQLGWQLWISAVVLIGLSFLLGEPAPDFANARAWLAFAYTGAVVAFASYVAWYWLLTRHAASKAAAFTFLVPVFGAFAGHLVLGEPLGWRFLGALALIAAGIFLVNRPART